MNEFTTQKPFRMEYEGKMVTTDELAAIRRKRSNDRIAAREESRKVIPFPGPTPVIKIEPPFQVELVWNRSFDFVSAHLNPHDDLDKAIAYAQSLENMGDGACVKKTRILDQAGNIAWQYGKKTLC